jgi:P27 family predicted phage terminase small subunit
MGRRPDPAAVKAQKTPVRSTRAAPAKAAVAEVVESGGKAPAWLTGEGLAIWRKNAPILRGQKLLSAADEPAFARYCRNFAKWLDLRKGLDRDGYTYDAETTSGGKLRRADPSFLIADRLERQLLAMEDRFGMNPSERQRLMMQRAAGGGGDLFSRGQREDDAATPAAEPAAPISGPIGMLNVH